MSASDTSVSPTSSNGPFNDPKLSEIDTAVTSAVGIQMPANLRQLVYHGVLNKIHTDASLSITNSLAPLQKHLRTYRLHHVEANDLPIPNKLLATVREVALDVVSPSLPGTGDFRFVRISGDTVLPLAEVQMPLEKAYRVKAIKVTGASESVPTDHIVKLDNDTFIVRSAEVDAVVVNHSEQPLSKRTEQDRRTVLHDSGALKIDEDADRHVAIWFEEEDYYDLQDPATFAQLSASGGRNLQVALTGVMTKSAARHYNCSVIHGNKAFLPRACSLDRGLELRNGIDCRLVYDADRTPMMFYTPCQGHFFPSMLVSDFMLHFCGPHVASSVVATGRLAQAKKALVGVEIVVATAQKFENRKLRIRGFASSVRDHPQATHGILGSPTVDSLQFPDMLCVNVGSAECPFYYPAEFCKIADDQVFHGELPIDVDASAYRPIGKFPTVRPAPASGPDLFAAVDSGDLSLAFAEIQVAASDSDTQTVKPATWALFKREIGERFGGKLQKAVKQAKCTTVNFEPGDPAWKSRLGDLVAHKSGIMAVLIAAVPKALPRDVVDDLKRFCDTVLGVQCHIISTTEINKRLRSEVTHDMVRYTGAQARKIFARAMYPGSATAGDVGSRSLPAPGNGRTLLAGIHIVSLQGIYGKAHFSNKPLDLGNMFLVSITSTNSDDDASTKQRPDSHTTHEICRIPGHSGPDSKQQQLASETVSAFAKHLNTVKKYHEERADHQHKWDHIAVYQSGLGTKDTRILDKQFHLLKTAIDSGMTASRVVVSLASLTPEPSITLVGSPDEPLDYLRLDRRADAQLTTFGPETTLQHTFRRPRGSHRAPASPWHVYRATTAGSAAAEISWEHRPRPDILYLAQRASKRARLLVCVKSSSDLNVDVDFPFELSKVREELDRTLYFL